MLLVITDITDYHKANSPNERSGAFSCGLFTTAETITLTCVSSVSFVAPQTALEARVLSGEKAWTRRLPNDRE